MTRTPHISRNNSIRRSRPLNFPLLTYMLTVSQITFGLESEQENISDNSHCNAKPCRWMDPLFFPGFAVIASFLALAAHGIYRKISGSAHYTQKDADGQPGPTSFLRKQTNRLGGTKIALFNVIRLLACLTLFSLNVYTAICIHNLHRATWLQYSLCTSSAYASLLAIWAIVTTPSWSRILIRHLTVVLLMTWIIFVYRDIWPFGTYTLQPLDIAEGNILWVKIGVLTFGAVILPLTIPRQYIPYNPEEPFEEVNPEQTASLLSLLLFMFMDSVIASARQTEHVPLEHLPALCDSDAMKNLVERSYKYIDPLQSRSNRHLFWKLMRIFAIEHVELVFLLAIMVASGFIAPVGINRLLAYLESTRQDPMIRPWVWVALLFLGPLADTVINGRYFFVLSRIIARLQGILTQVVFDHSLRIRLKTDDMEIVTEEQITAVSTTYAHPSEDQEQTADNQTSSDGLIHSTTTPSGSAASTSKDSDSTKEADLQQTKSHSKGSNMIGKINNLVTTDLAALESGQRTFLLVLFYTPFHIVVSVIFLYVILDWSVFVGIGVMILLSFLPGIVTKLSHNVQKEKMKKSDARVQTVTEIISGAIRTVKLFGWERKMSQRIDEQRQEELNSIRTAKFLWLATGNLGNLIPIVTMVVTFATYTLVMKKELTASKVFSSMAVFDSLQLRFKGFANAIPVVIQAQVALDRINDFLSKTELLDAFSGAAEYTSLGSGYVSPDVVGIRAASFSWDKNTHGTETPGRNSRNFKLCIKNEVIFKREQINLIIGQTGSGKTSLLMALLGEMHYVPMGPNSMVSLPREGGVAYHAQESWVLNETIRNNILFGSPYIEERYKKVIEQCALERDLSLFDAGDDTEVGEKGTTLSGGQKARITLARAVYSQAAILVLDDVLAALDVHTAQWIVEKCFKGDLIQGRTVILVTHNVALAAPIADFVVCLSVDGGVLSTGSLSSALAKDEKLSAEIAKESKAREKGDSDINMSKPDVDGPKASGKLVVEEEIAVGHVGWTALKLLFSNTGSSVVGLIFFWAINFGFLFISKLSIILGYWVLALWAKQYEISDPSEISVPRYLSLYAAIYIFSVITVCIGYTVFIVGTLRASRVIHKLLIDTLLRSTWRWLDITPSSRIIARCTQDIAAIDTNVVMLFNHVTQMTFDIVLKFFTVIIMSPTFTIPGLLVGVIGGWLGQVFMRAQLAVKRELSNAKSPVLGHFGAAISGSVSVRAYGAEEAFRQESFLRINRYTRVTRTYWNLDEWVTVRAELLGGVFSAALAAYLVYGRQADASDTGFSITIAVSFSTMIIHWVNSFNTFEVQGNSLERLHQYLLIEQEPKPTEDGIPPAHWPSSGDLRVEDLSARYSPDGPEVLHNITFHVKSGERVGIVGRTGSGKSSLTLALLRCILTKGKVYYDGLATDSVNLDALRSQITIIPQVPELLAGTLRENIDPFGQYEDAILNDALRAAGLFSLQSKTNEARLTLDSAISSGGGNISIGQRQIIALARAIVRQSKLLILDEATSAIDYETDSVIQESLRKEVAKDVTLLTIAHRLQTIMDSDVIMVLDAGRIVEFGKPSKLLENAQGFLRSLVDASGDKERLHAMVVDNSST